MPQSAFDYRTSGAESSSWTQNFSIAPAGSSAAPLFSLYPSKGDVTIGADTLIQSVLNGPMVVARYRALTVNAALTVSNGCRGLVLLCDTLNIGAAGKIHMNGKAPYVCRNDDVRFPFSNVTVPKTLAVSARYFANPKAFLDWIALTGAFPGDLGLWAGSERGLGDMNFTVTPGDVPIVTVSGCGSGGVAVTGTVSNWTSGGNATAGTNAPGGGGGGGTQGVGSRSGAGAAGNPYGGGLGGGDGYLNSSAWGGPAYYSGIHPLGASTPTARPGGLVIVVCRGNVTIASGGKISADAESNAATMAVGGIGGGRAALIYGGTLSNSGSLTAAAGAAGSSGGGAGGAGVADAKTFAAMGW